MDENSLFSGVGGVPMQREDADAVAAAIAVCLDLAARHHAASEGMFRHHFTYLLALTDEWAQATGDKSGTIVGRTVNVTSNLAVTVLGVMAEMNSKLDITPREHETGPEMRSRYLVVDGARERLRAAVAATIRVA